MKNILLITASFILIVTVSNARVAYYTLGMGNLTQQAKRVQVDKDGNTKLFQLRPYFHFGGRYKLSKNFSFYPEFGVTIPSSGEDKNIKRMNYFANGVFGYTVSRFIFRLGTGLFYSRITGTGGTQTLDNGTGQQDFPLPEGSSASRNLMTIIGVEYRITKHWSGRLETYVANVDASINRAVYHTISFHYAFKNFKTLFSSRDGNLDKNK